MNISIKTLDHCLMGAERVVGVENFRLISKVVPFEQADEGALVFIASNIKNKEAVLKKTKASVIICDFIPEDEKMYFGKCLIITDNPKLYFARLVNRVLENSIEATIHSTAVIHPEARIAPGVTIGAHVYVGKSEIGEGSVIYPNVSIYDNVIIGKNVIIDSGTVIGAAGFGFVRDEENIPVPFPQLGGVVIGNNVEIGANVCIDRGALRDTVIGDNTKIDNFSQISHNTIIGKNNYVIGADIAGSVTIGDNCWIAPSRIMNKRMIGNNVTVGFGSVVLNNLESDSVHMGNPARKIEDYAKLQLKLKKLLKGDQWK